MLCSWCLDYIYTLNSTTSCTISNHFVHKQMASSVLARLRERVYTTRYFHPGAVFFAEATTPENFILVLTLNLMFSYLYVYSCLQLTTCSMPQFFPQSFGRTIHNVEPDSGHLLVSLNCKAANVLQLIPLMKSRQTGLLLPWCRLEIFLAKAKHHGGVRAHIHIPRSVGFRGRHNAYFLHDQQWAVCVWTWEVWVSLSSNCAATTSW